MKIFGHKRKLEGGEQISAVQRMHTMGGNRKAHVVVKKTVQGRNWSTKAWEPVLHTRVRQEAYKDEVGTYEDRSVWIW